MTSTATPGNKSIVAADQAGDVNTVTVSVVRRSGNDAAARKVVKRHNRSSNPGSGAIPGVDDRHADPESGFAHWLTPNSLSRTK